MFDPHRAIVKVSRKWFSAFVRNLLEGETFAARVAYPLCVGVLCLTQLLLGWKIAGQVNHDTDAFDQGAYVLMAGRMQGAWFPWYSDGTRNPLLPWIAQVALDPADPEFFEKSKRLNVVLGVLGTGLLGLLFRRRLGPLAAWNATALAGFALLLPSSTFFGAETLFYPLFLFAFVACMRLLNANSLGGYAAAGALCGLAALAKASVAPLIALFLGWSLVRLFFPGFGSVSASWSKKRFGLGIVLFLGMYLALLAPRMVHSHQTWGSPFYSLPSFWMWADDWETCVEKYTDCRKETLEAMPPEERPTLQGYFLRNSFPDAVNRLTRGVSVRLQQFLHPELKWRFPFEKPGRPKSVVLPHRGFYLVGLALLATAMAAWHIGTFSGASRTPPAGNRSPIETPSRNLSGLILPACFFLSAWVLYAMATGWYLPTGPGHRFVLMLYLPTLWVVCLGGEWFRKAAGSSAANATYLATHLAIAILLLSRALILIFDGTFKKVSFTF